MDETLRAKDSRPVVIGLCGAQGSGKSTLARAAREACEANAISAAVLSIDDLYQTKDERELLARDVHPLLATRGPPGTHDVPLGNAVLDSLGRGQLVSLPRFDKARDDRAPESQWLEAPERCDVLLLEGWCVGARPQADAALGEPVNRLEAFEDQQGIWRRHVNAALASVYQSLFARIDCLAMLAAPDFEVVFEWRMQQEAELAECAGTEASGVMNKEQVARFIQHYERLTRHMLAEMPERADLLVRLDHQRRAVEIRRAPKASR
ncbi:MAG: zeta toxin family protein [Novosphingobium sp.]|nr:zeta toxin family protein [Novosphingobium sp.]